MIIVFAFVVFLDTSLVKTSEAHTVKRICNFISNQASEHPCTIQRCYSLSTEEKVVNFKPLPHLDPSGFIIAGENSNETISNLNDLTGASMAQLDARADSPGGGEDGGGGHLLFAYVSQEEKLAWAPLKVVPARKAAFIRANQTVKSILLRDNEWVLSHQLTHQKLIEPLLTAMEKLEKLNDAIEATGLVVSFPVKSVQFEWNGKKYLIEGEPAAGALFYTGPKSGWIHKGTQGSFFNDQLFANWHFTVTDLQTQQKLTGDALTPHLIYRYGFYQGGAYRLSPEKIAAFFHI